MTQIHGTSAAGFERVRDAFAMNFERHDEHAAAVSVYWRGEPVVDLWGGPTYHEQTIQVLFSAGKPVAAVVALSLVEKGALTLDEPIARVWPEFGGAGKASITLRWLLAHRAGLAAVSARLTVFDLAAVSPVVRALEAETPNWEPGTAHGYHAVTWGFVLGEIVRRVTGRSLGQFFREEIAEPGGIELWVGLPRTEESRLTTLRPEIWKGGDDERHRRVADHGSLARRALANPFLPSGALNSIVLLRAEMPSINAVGSARGLARFYAKLIETGDGAILSPATVAAMAATEAIGPDLVMPYETHYGLGVQLPSPRRPMAGAGSFGHAGYGGPIAWAHPGLGLAFAYTSDQPQSTAHIGDARSDSLARAALDSIHDLAATSGAH